jgi:voltage-gated potassium channel Kch
MLRLILSALGLATVTVMLHGIGTVTVAAHVVEFWASHREARTRFGGELLLARLVSLLLLLHLAEAVVWAVFIYLIGELPDLESSLYFSLKSYTTVGYGDVVLAAPWRLLGPIEAAVGVLMLGWSTGILVAVIAMVYRDLFPTLRQSAEPPR